VHPLRLRERAKHRSKVLLSMSTETKFSATNQSAGGKTPSYMNPSRSGPPDGRVEDGVYVHDVIGPKNEKLICRTCGSPNSPAHFLYIKPFYGHRVGSRVVRKWLDPSGNSADKGQLATVTWVSKDRTHIQVIMAADPNKTPILVASGKFVPSGNMLTTDVNDGLAQQFKKENAAAQRFSSGASLSSGAFAQWAKLSSTSPDNPLAAGGTQPVPIPAAQAQPQQPQQPQAHQTQQAQHRGIQLPAVRPASARLAPPKQGGSAAFRSPGRDAPVVGVMAPGDGLLPFGKNAQASERTVWVKMIVPKSHISQTPGGSLRIANPQGQSCIAGRLDPSMQVRPVSTERQGFVSVRDTARTQRPAGEPLSTSSRKAAAAAAAACAAPTPILRPK